jgi:hypothetical protein
MDASTSTSDSGLFLLYEFGDLTVGEIVPEIKIPGLKTANRRSGGRWSNPSLDELRRARIVIVLFGEKGWTQWLQQGVSVAQALFKPVIIVLIGEASESLLASGALLVGQGQVIRWRGPGSLSELLVAIEGYRESPVVYPVDANTTGDELDPSGSPSDRPISDPSPASPKIEPPDSSLVGDADPETSDSLLRLLSARGIDATSPLARRLLEFAAYMDAKQDTRGQVTRSRLIIAAYDLGPDFASTGDRDSVGVAALRIVLDRDLPNFRDLRRTYLGGETPGIFTGQIVLTPNIEAILEGAMRSGFAAQGDGTKALTANALVGAMLNQQDTGLEEWFDKAKTGLGHIRAALFRELVRRDPERVRLWAAELNQPMPLIDLPEPAEPESGPASLAEMWNDNPERTGLVDRLGVEAEAQAFARVAAAKNIVPPLAFGIFGDWGSGKSFFMRLLHDYVDKLQNKEVDEAKSGEVFHSLIVQIRFNAWHYVDTNLWASLVDHIFSEMNRWMLDPRRAKGEATAFDKLSSARDLTIDSVQQLIRRRKDQKDAAQRLSEAEQALTLAEKNVGTTPGVLWGAVKLMLQEQGVAGHLATAAKRLGFDHLAASTEQLKNTLDDLKVQTNRARIEGDAIRKKLLSGRYLAPAMLAIVVGPPFFLLGVDHLKTSANGTWKPFLDYFNALTVGGATVLATVTTALATATGMVRSGIGKLEKYREKLDDAISCQLRTPTEAVKTAQENLARQAAKVQEARALLKSTTERLAEAASEYASDTGRARLLKFVRQRATDEQYTKHLGLVSKARRDFSELSSMMSGAEKAEREAADKRLAAYQEKVTTILDSAEAQDFLTADDRNLLRESAEKVADDQTPTFERIVLYIDDLDRCPPNKVTEVLQAVHLLLAFPLFVVVVAVDVRWVSRSLEKHYDTLLRGDGRRRDDDVAAPRDYLEKIFQVPYWVRPMTKEASRQLLFGMAAPRRPAEPRPIADPAPLSPGPDVAPVAPTLAAGAPSTTTAGSPPVALAQTEEEKVRAAEAAATEQRRREEAERKRLQDLAAKALALTGPELAFMQALAPCVGRTPRRALRFLNVYRVIKASMGPTDLSRLEGHGGYRALMCQLAISTAAPGLQKEWLELMRQLDANASMDEIVAATRDLRKVKRSPDAGLVVEAVEALRLPPQGLAESESMVENNDVVTALQDSAVEYLRYYAEIARRYSFSDKAPPAE